MYDGIIIVFTTTFNPVVVNILNEIYFMALFRLPGECSFTP